jgi:hypothetical protein
LDNSSSRNLVGKQIQTLMYVGVESYKKL